MRWLLLIAAIMTIATLLAVWRGEELPPATMGDRGPAIAMPPAAGAAAPANSPVGSDSSPDLPSAAVSTGATPGATTIPADAVSTPAADEPQGPALRGRVFGIDSTPIAGAVVTLLPVLDGRVAAPLTTTGLPSARTAADGRFTIRFANESPRDLAVAARGWSPTVVAAVTPIPNGPEWIVTLARPSRVAGRVVAVPGTGAGGITVQVWMAGAAPSRAPPDLGPGDLCPGGQLVAERVLAADGAFTFDDLPAGRAVVGVTPQHGSVHEIVPLAPGSEHTIELVLPVPGRVHGRAEPGCCVFLFGGQASRFVTAAADGAFEFAAVPPAKYLIG
ncbi:MAG: hypothetical protein KDE27_01665, partial [Planctomycetes bacterium]|nr:hypothetical protein [Planctomycetota bacterium]